MRGATGVQCDAMMCRTVQFNDIAVLPSAAAIPDGASSVFLVGVCMMRMPVWCECLYNEDVCIMRMFVWCGFLYNADVCMV